MYTDSSDFGIGSVLGQADDTGNFRPISFASKKFSESERLLPVIEREAMAVLFALKQFEQIIYGSLTIVYTDHSPLPYISITASMSSKLTRWCLAIQRFNATIVHIKGVDNSIADSISRLV